MLAAHRDQENLLHSQQIPAKQQHKTPGARYPKTPSRFQQNDENAPISFGGKTGLGGTSKFAGNDKTMTKRKQAMVTPLDTRNRAPLGNKTTNAKAKAGQTGGVKGIVKELEKTQLKPTATQKNKQKSAELAPTDFEVRERQKPSEEEEEPEYAPPRPVELPYESDVLPKNLLTFEGLKSENLLKGYYQHFYNPIDDDGVSRQEREFEETMKKVMTKAEARNQRETDELKWNIADLTDSADGPSNAIAVANRRVKRTPSQHPPTVASRRAASALSIHSDSTRGTKIKPLAQATMERRPLSSLLPGKRTTKDTVPTKASSAVSAVGEAASRTTIGYKRGRSASSMIHNNNNNNNNNRGPSETVRAVHPTKSSETLDSLTNLTITPARLRQAALKKQESRPRPQFMSIFDNEGDDEDLPAMSQPLQFSDDEEDFELKFEI
ncbi:hypothetical protein G7046_g8611 [Stylonectria norvegica]|nr:hypothetical protein G7046_g8611 [Stylonectria norvegica]